MNLKLLEEWRVSIFAFCAISLYCWYFWSKHVYVRLDLPPATFYFSLSAMATICFSCIPLTVNHCYSTSAISESQIYLLTHAESYLMGLSNQFNEMAQTQMTPGHRKQGLLYCGALNWNEVCKGSYRDLMEQDACEDLFTVSKKKGTGHPAETLFSTGREQPSKLQN